MVPSLFEPLKLYCTEIKLININNSTLRTILDKNVYTLILAKYKYILKIRLSSWKYEGKEAKFYIAFIFINVLFLKHMYQVCD